MDSLAPLAQRMPYTAAFPKALGTGLLISTPRPITAELRGEMERFIDEYEHALSRFRADSLVAHIGNAEHGGHFDFPDWAGPLFDLYDALHAATRGAIDPCVGEDLIRLGYDPALSFTVEADAGERLGTVPGAWGRCTDGPYGVVMWFVRVVRHWLHAVRFMWISARAARVIWWIRWADCSPIQNFRAHRMSSQPKRPTRHANLPSQTANAKALPRNL